MITLRYKITHHLGTTQAAHTYREAEAALVEAPLGSFSELVEVSYQKLEIKQGDHNSFN